MEVMLDLETLSTRCTASIAVIAAIRFDRNRDIPFENCDKFYRLISAQSCRELDLHVDPNTIDWWKQQDVKLQQEIFQGNRIPIKTALKEFSEWYHKTPTEKIWSQGACFDVPILDEAYKRAGMEAPWKFWQVRDTRTVYDLANLNSRDLPSENLHHALHDCWRQIIGIKQGIKKIS